MKRIIILLTVLIFWECINAQNQLTNTGNFHVYSGATITVFGDFTHNGTLTVDNGATLTSNGTLTFNGGTIANSGTYVYGGSSSINYNDVTQQTSGAELSNTNGPSTITINNAGGLLLGSNTIINNLIFTSGNLNINGKTLTINGAVTNTSGTFTGSSTSNITVGGTAGTINFDQTNASTSSLNNFLINSSSSAIIGTSLNVFGTLTISGTLDANSKNLVLKSNSSGTASIAAITGTFNNATNITTERYISSQGRRWRFLSSSCSGRTLADWKNNIHITGIAGNTNGFDNTSSNLPSVYWYDESIITGNLNTGYTAATNITNSIVTGRGYRVFVRGPRTDSGLLDGTNNVQNAVTIATVGSVNSGDINMNPSFTSSGTIANDGWNLLGNPYPSALDWSSFHTAGRSGTSPDFTGTNYSHIDAVIYIFDATSNSYKSYNAVAATGTLTNGIIPSGSAFFIKAAAGSPTMIFKESFKTASVPIILQKSAAVNELHIKLIADSNDYDEYIFKLTDGSSKAKDSYDIVKLPNVDLNLSSYGTDEIQLTLNSYPSINIKDVIPLNIMGHTGVYKLEFSEVANFDTKTDLFLRDNFSATITDIRMNKFYSFTIDTNIKASFGNKRFELFFDKTATGIYESKNELSTNAFVYPNPVQNILNIGLNNYYEGKVQFRIIEETGKEILSGNIHFDKSEKNILDISSLIRGIYFLELIFDKTGTKQIVKFIK